MGPTPPRSPQPDDTQPSPVPESAVAFDALGVGVTVEVTDPALLPDVRAVLPGSAEQRAPAPGDDRFALKVAGDKSCTLTVNGAVRKHTEDVVGALIALGAHLFMHVMSEAPDRLFVHAGAVGIDGRAIVLTGGTGIGKSTLIAALARAGALYYTDDYAPIDEHGLLHPYPMPLGLKDPDSGRYRDYTIESLGGSAGKEPLPVALVASIEYTGGSGLRVLSRSAGDGSLMLMRHAFGVDRRPAFAVRATANATAEALVVEGERGEADTAAAELIKLALDPRESPRDASG